MTILSFHLAYYEGKGTKLGEGERDLEGDRAIFRIITFGIVTIFGIQDFYVQDCFIREKFMVPNDESKRL
jgi:hypothetical protein